MNRRSFAQLLCADLSLVMVPPDGVYAATRKEEKKGKGEEHPRSYSERAWSLLETLAASTNPQHRQWAAGGLAIFSDASPRALNRVRQLLRKDHDDTVRAFTASALGQEKCRAARPALREALDDESGAVALAAAKALWDMNDHSGATIFVQVVTGERKDKNGLLTGYLQDARHTLRNPRSLAMMGAREAVGAFFGPAAMAISFAQDSMKDKGAPSRAFAATALANERTVEARHILESALQDDNAVVRAAACRSLALMGNSESIPFIEALLFDKNDVAQAVASGSYLRLTTLRARKEKEDTVEPEARPGS